jgi:predicted small metal-binding protein
MSHPAASLGLATRVCHRASMVWHPAPTLLLEVRRRFQMKTMTCKELGGNCDQKLSAESWDEMIKVMTKHVMDRHPDVAEEMEKMHKQDPQKWAKEMKPKWNAAPEL